MTFADDRLSRSLLMVLCGTENNNQPYINLFSVLWQWGYLSQHRRLLQEEEFCVVDILVKVRVSETQIGVGENPQYLQENINLL